MKRSYRYETHTHTAEGSACAKSTGKEMARAHIEAGYAGMVVTDHFFNGNTAIPRDLPWATMVELFCKGYENALDEARGTDFQVFFGWEYNYHATEFLTYGLDKEFLLKHPDLLSWNIEKYFDIVHRNGGFIIHAHPFRERFYIDTIRLYPNDVDAVEVINGGHVNSKLFDERALAYAQEHQLLQMSGADSHYIDDIQGYGIEFDYKIDTIDELILGIKNQDHIIVDIENK